MGEVKLTPRQLVLARSALGLTDGRVAAYRNRFSTAPGTDDHAEWMRMRRKGAAHHRSAKAVGGTLDLFWLTRAGAEAALRPGESLDPEDFPHVRQAPAQEDERHG